MSNITWTYLTPKARRAAFSCAQGTYQRSLLNDGQSWAGSDLTGNAARYRQRYQVSAMRLLDRLAAHPLLSAEETRGEHNRRVVVVTTKAERRRIGDRPIIDAAEAIIDKAAKAREAARRKAEREAARAARHLAEDMPILASLAAA